MTIKLLITEDNDDAREVTRLIIARKFPEITFYLAENGRKGVELFKEHGADIVITDINMPIMDGYQMAVEIKAIKAATRFILLTAYNDKRYLNKFKDIGINHYISKPVQFVKLYAAIEESIADILANRPC